MTTTRRLVALLLAAAFVLGVLTLGGGVATAVQAIAVGPNLLANPGFEEGFSERVDPYEGGIPAGELTVANGWAPWYDNTKVCPTVREFREWRIPARLWPDECHVEGYNNRPEYKGDDNPMRVHSGGIAQKMFTTYSTHTAGIYQRVEGLPAGTWVRFTIWVQTWSSHLESPDVRYSLEPGYYTTSVGIDPVGGTDFRSDAIVWSRPVHAPDRWVQLTVDAYTPTGTVTVWTRGQQRWPVKHNDSYWDDASLMVLSEAPPPTPSITPTNTPYPTPQATPAGYQPPACGNWATVGRPPFVDGGAPQGWGIDPYEGSVTVEQGALVLRNGPAPSGAFPLAWTEHAWPSGDMRLSFRFSFANATGYGTGISVGSEPYDGERLLQGHDPIWGIDNLVKVEQRDGGPGSFRIGLMGNNVWTGASGDTSWHTLTLERRANTLILYVDGVEVGRNESHWYPQSLHLGNPVILGYPGRWTEVAIADVRWEICLAALQPTARLPLVLRSAVWPTPTPGPVPTLPSAP